MSMQGTWCDVLIIQVVAESLNIQIYIVESHVNIGQVTLIEPHHTSSQQTGPVYKLCRGLVNEVHYVSTYSGNEHHRIAIVISVSHSKIFFLNKNIQVVEKENRIYSDLKNIGISTISGENDKCKSKTNEQ